jgi:hypothetical protein
MQTALAGKPLAVSRSKENETHDAHTLPTEANAVVKSFRKILDDTEKLALADDFNDQKVDLLVQDTCEFRGRIDEFVCAAREMRVESSTSAALVEEANRVFLWNATMLSRTSTSAVSADLEADTITDAEPTASTPTAVPTNMLNVMPSLRGHLERYGCRFRALESNVSSWRAVMKALACTGRRGSRTCTYSATSASDPPSARAGHQGSDTFDDIRDRRHNSILYDFATENSSLHELNASIESIEMPSAEKACPTPLDVVDSRVHRSSAEDFADRSMGTCNTIDDFFLGEVTSLNTVTRDKMVQLNELHGRLCKLELRCKKSRLRSLNTCLPVTDLQYSECYRPRDGGEGDVAGVNASTSSDPSMYAYGHTTAHTHTRPSPARTPVTQGIGKHVESLASTGRSGLSTGRSMRSMRSTPSSEGKRYGLKLEDLYDISDDDDPSDGGRSSESTGNHPTTSASASPTLTPEYVQRSDAKGGTPCARNRHSTGSQGSQRFGLTADDSDNEGENGTESDRIHCRRRAPCMVLRGVARRQRARRWARVAAQTSPSDNVPARCTPDAATFRIAYGSTATWDLIKGVVPHTAGSARDSTTAPKGADAVHITPLSTLLSAARDRTASVAEEHKKVVERATAAAKAKAKALQQSREAEQALSSDISATMSKIRHTSPTKGSTLGAAAGRGVDKETGDDSKETINASFGESRTKGHAMGMPPASPSPIKPTHKSPSRLTPKSSPFTSTPSSSSSSAPPSLREVLLKFYGDKIPEKLGDVDKVVEKFKDSTDITKVLAKFNKKYGEMFQPYIPDCYAVQMGLPVRGVPAGGAAASESTADKAHGAPGDAKGGAGSVFGMGSVGAAVVSTPSSSSLSSSSASASAAAAASKTVAEQIREIYEKHNAEKLGEVPALLAKHAGREADLLARIQKKYLGASGPVDSAAASATTAGSTLFGSAGSSGVRAASGGQLDITKSGWGKPPTGTQASSGTGTTPFAKLSSPPGSGTSTPSSLFKPQAGFPTPFGQQSPPAGGPSLGSTSGTASPFAPQASPSAATGTAAGGFGGGTGVGFGSKSGSVFGQQTGMSGPGLTGAGAVATGGTATSSLFGGGGGGGGGIGQQGGSVGGFAGGFGAGQAGQAGQGAPPSVPEIGLRLRNIYAKYEPGKVETVPTLMQKYAGKEMELLAKVEKKYLGEVGTHQGVQMQGGGAQQSQMSAGGGGGGAWGTSPFGGTTGMGGGLFGSSSQAQPSMPAMQSMQAASPFGAGAQSKSTPFAPSSSMGQPTGAGFGSGVGGVGGSFGSSGGGFGGSQSQFGAGAAQTPFGSPAVPGPGPGPGPVPVSGFGGLNAGSADAGNRSSSFGAGGGGNTSPFAQAGSAGIGVGGGAGGGLAARASPTPFGSTAAPSFGNVSAAGSQPSTPFGQAASSPMPTVGSFGGVGGVGGAGGRFAGGSPGGTLFGSPSTSSSTTTPTPFGQAGSHSAATASPAFGRSSQLGAGSQSAQSGWGTGATSVFRR